MPSRFLTLLMLTLITLLSTPLDALAQRYPFFVQPISVQDLKPIADELQLSPSQVEAVITFHENYGEQFNALQEGELQELVDRAMDIAQNMNFMGGQQFTIPTRKEIESVIDAALKVWRAFERIDGQFFDEVRGLLHEEQFAALERLRNRRQADAYRTVHLRVVEFNDGASVDIHSMIERLDLSTLEEEALHEPMRGYERSLVRLCRRLQDEIIAAIGIVLDEVDRMGLRDMEMMEMMTLFADEAKQDELKALFDEQSRPMQEAAAEISELNWKTYGKIFPALPPDKALDFQERYVREVYRGAGSEVFKARTFIERAMDLPSVSVGQQEEMQAIFDRLNTSFASLLTKIAKATEAKRAYRPIAELEDESLSVHQADIDRYRAKADELGEDSLEATKRLLNPDQLELLEQETPDDENETPRWARGRRGGGGGATHGSTDAGGFSWRGNFPIPPMAIEQVNRFALWVGVPESELSLIETLHEGYMADYESLAEEYNEKLQAEYDIIEEDESGRGQWLKRREIRVALTGTYEERLGDREDGFFEEFTVLLPPGLDPELVTTIRRAQDRARERVSQRQGDWVLRQQPESSIDVGSILLAADPGPLDKDEKNKAIAILGDYEEMVSGDIALLDDQLEKLQSLQERLWSGDEYDEGVREKMETLRQKRRKEVGETAVRLTLTNRNTIGEMVDVLPEETSWLIREEYDKAAYPGVYSDNESLDDMVEELFALESMTPAERQSLETLLLDHRGRYRELTDEMLTRAKAQATNNFTWPPDEGTMESWMKSEQLKYQRGELNSRTRTRIVLLLGEERSASVRGLLDDGSQSDEPQTSEEAVIVEVELGE